MTSNATFHCLNNFTFLKWLNFVFLKGIKNMNGLYFFFYVVLGKEFRKVIQIKWRKTTNQLSSNVLMHFSGNTLKTFDVNKDIDETTL